MRPEPAAMRLYGSLTPSVASGTGIFYEAAIRLGRED